MNTEFDRFEAAKEVVRLLMDTVRSLPGGHTALGRLAATRPQVFQALHRLIEAGPVPAPACLAVQERGPWRLYTNNGKFYAASEDFTHDVSLQVIGNFANDEQRKAYTEEICRRLNAATPASEPYDESRPKATVGQYTHGRRAHLQQQAAAKTTGPNSAEAGSRPEAKRLGWVLVTKDGNVVRWSNQVHGADPAEGEYSHLPKLADEQEPYNAPHRWMEVHCVDEVLLQIWLEGGGNPDLKAGEVELQNVFDLVYGLNKLVDECFAEHGESPVPGQQHALLRTTHSNGMEPRHDAA